MIKKLGIFLFLGIFAFCAGPAFAGDLDVELYCPSSVNAGSTLNLKKVVISNDGENSVTLNRYAAGIVGNFNNILNTSRVYGPYAKSLSYNKIISAGQSVTINNLLIVSPVSTDLRGKMALVVVDFIDSNGRSFGGNTCLVNVQ